MYKHYNISYWIIDNRQPTSQCLSLFILQELWKYPKVLDLGTLYSNNIHKIAQTYGIEAGRRALIKVWLSLFIFYFFFCKLTGKVEIKLRDLWSYTFNANFIENFICPTKNFWIHFSSFTHVCRNYWSRDLLFKCLRRPLGPKASKRIIVSFSFLLFI